MGRTDRAGLGDHWVRCLRRDDGRGAVNYSTILGFVPLSSPGFEPDGFGVGGFGTGGFGIGGDATYFWKSNPLTNGTWNFGVKPIDAAGNEGTAVTISATISAAPQPPPRDPTTGNRLAVTYSSTTHKATLSWSAAP